MNLDPGVLTTDAEGRMRSVRYGDVYKSAAGALAEGECVFVDGARLRPRWAGRDAFAVLELGFGIGANFFATLAAWRAPGERPKRLDFVSVEAHPLPVAQLADAMQRIGVGPADRDRLSTHWPLPLPGLHRIPFDDGRVVLTLAFGEAAEIVPRLGMAADAFFLDGFSPATNPAMWAPPLLRQLARRARPGATLATYTVAADVRRGLADAGFVSEIAPGFAPKRHRLQAEYRPAWRTWPTPPAAPRWPSREVLVVGSGIAGAAVAAGFAARGWRVTVVERSAAGLAGGSAQPRLATHLHLSPDDSRLARLTRASLAAIPERSGRVGALAQRAVDARIGKLILATGGADDERQRRLLERLAFPAGFVRRVERDEAADCAGIALPRGGLWLPRCDAMDPAARCAAWLDDPAIELRRPFELHALQPEGSQWWAHDASRATVGPFALVVLCNAGEALALAGLRSPAMVGLRGQSSIVRSARLSGLRCLLGGDAYACPMPDGEVVLGSTFDDRESLAVDPRDDASNLRRTARMLGDPDFAAAARVLRSATGRRWSARDRLPLIGWAPDEAVATAGSASLLRNAKLPLPRMQGLMLASGFGARGALWAPLAGLLLPALADGLPLPIESDLAAAVDPARFLREALRRGTLN